VGFWGQQCAQKGNGSTKYSVAQMTQITQCIDASSKTFNFGSAPFDGFCAYMNPPRPMDCKKQAHRQFAGLLANLCAGQLQLITNNGEKITLDPNAPNPCKGSFPDAKNLGELIAAMDQTLADLDAKNAGSQDQGYCMVSECADGINNGQGIPLAPGCAEGVTAPTGKNMAGALDLDGASAAVSGAPVLELYRPTPNPFSNTTTFAYAVNQGEGADVQIGIFNVAGRQVRQLVNGYRAAGQYQTVWDGRDDSGSQVMHGVYFVRAFVGGRQITDISRVLYLR